MKIIITETQLKTLEFKRRLDELPKYIRNAYDWLNPKAFNTFDEFINRVITNAASEFIREFMGEPDYDYFQLLRNKIQPFVEDLVMDEFNKEIFDYYNK